MTSSKQTPSLPTTSAELPNGAELLLDTLMACGVDTVFGYPGGAALPLYDAYMDSPTLREIF